MTTQAFLISGAFEKPLMVSTVGLAMCFCSENHHRFLVATGDGFRKIFTDFKLRLAMCFL